MPKSIPDGLTRQHVLTALEELDAGIEHSFGAPSAYQLTYDGKAYAPKAAIGLAFRHLTGSVLSHRDFSGGEQKGQANFVLRELGFEVEPIRTVDISRRKPVVPRPYELYEVGYFLCRCGETPENGGPAHPPRVLGVTTWERAYAVFFSSLSDGRTLRSFCNTLKNIRDLFDGHIDSGRVGWQQTSLQNRREPRILTGNSLAVFERWNGQSESGLWNSVQQYADMRVPQISDSVLADQMAQLDPDHEQISLRTEGGRRVIVSTRAERDLSIRDEALRIHGTRCMACDFCFEDVYGEWGAGFIEVHHLIPIAESGPRETNPETDLAVLCANCHRMVHRRRGIALTLNELRAKLRR